MAAPVTPGFSCRLLPRISNASLLLPRGPRDLHTAALFQSEPPPLSAEGKNYLTLLPHHGQSTLLARKSSARPSATASGDHTAAAGVLPAGLLLSPCPALQRSVKTRKAEARVALAAGTGHVDVIYRRPTHPSAAGLCGKFLSRLKRLLHVPRIKNEPGGFTTSQRTPVKRQIQNKGLKNLPCQTIPPSDERTAQGGA